MCIRHNPLNLKPFLFIHKKILLSEYNVNILDISQTILQGAFTMVMAVDVGKSTASIGELGTALAELGAKMDLSIRIQREEIFDAMHNI